eukprot:scaffold7176_cov134-Cylindrotheca_fusiformis.AAC.10
MDHHFRPACRVGTCATSISSRMLPTTHDQSTLSEFPLARRSLCLGISILPTVLRIGEGRNLKPRI